ncbi:Anaphase-promoting complex subunit 7 [Aphelenchoides bicaudatus]|nr:Anaphase-promoting complex subunit 7 [Aphelenchoides bicaudatus]
MLDDELESREQAMLFKLIGDSYYFTDCFYQSIKFYERALEIVRHLPRNAYPKPICCQAELRFLIHKALLRERNYEQAIKQLNLIPKNESTPKSRAALAKLLTTRHSKQSKAEIIACHNSILSQFPTTALYTQNELYKLNSNAKRTEEIENDENDLPTSAYFRARLLLNQQMPLEAIAALKEYKHPNPKICLELATLYNNVGNRTKAIAEFERLRLIDPYGFLGMDVLAGLYYANQLTNKPNGKLESLVNFLNECHPNEPETFLAMAYLSKQKNNQKESALFAQRALVLSQPGKDKGNAALLRALILIESRNYEPAFSFLQNILKFDSQNIDAFELNIRANLQRKNYEAAKLIGQACRKSIGLNNPRAMFIYAQSIEHSSSKDEYEQCLRSLVQQFPYLTDGVVTLGRFLERKGRYNDAIQILEKASETNLNPIIQEILTDLKSKCKKVDGVLSSRQSITSQNEASDSFVLHASLNNSFSLAITPNCGIPAALPHRPIQNAPRRQRSNAIRQSGIDLLQRLEMEGSPTLETMRRDFMHTPPHNSIFETPNAYIDEMDEEIDVGGGRR